MGDRRPGRRRGEVTARTPVSRRTGPARFFVPGRIEVLGKHTDYAGGRSLLAAVDRGFTVAVEPADDDRITIHDTGRRETVTLPVPGDESAAGSEAPADGPSPAGSGGRPGSPAPEPGWAVYPRTVLRRAAGDFPGRLRGCRIEIEGDLPAAAGLSTSSALITAVFLALDAVCGLTDSAPHRAGRVDSADSADPSDPGVRVGRESLAGYLGAVERGSPYPGLGGVAGDRRGGPEGVGTRGGSEDHVAILCAEPGALVRYAFEPVRREGEVPVPAGHVFAVAASGVVAEKKGAARARYNRLSDEAARVAALWRSATGEDHPHIGAILDDAGVRPLYDALWCGAGRDERDALRRRVRHFVAESTEIVPAASDALAGGDLVRFGELVDRSQRLAEELLGNQVPETVHLARSARELGAAAASAFGAGFGGSVWALVPTPDAVVFLDDWCARYLDAFPGRTSDAAFFTSPAAAPARTR